MAPGEPTIAIGPLARTGYGLAVTSFATALTVWYAGPCPGILTIVPSSLPEQQPDQIFMHSLPPSARGLA